MIVPNGQAIVQTLQPTQVGSRTIFAPVTGSSLMASTGQAIRHQASSHCVQVYGTKRPSWWNVNTLMRDFAMVKVPYFSHAHAISHWRHPVHLLGSRWRDFCIESTSFRWRRGEAPFLEEGARPARLPVVAGPL